MQGVGSGMTGVASVFGMPRGLEAQIKDGKWVSISSLNGRWILIIPEDAYARYGLEFDRAIGGKPLDARVESTGAIGGFSLLNVNQAAVKQLCELIAQMPPLPEEASPQTQRVTVGRCTACGRDLRIKAHAVRPTLHLTCKCGAKNTVTQTTDEEVKPPSGTGADK
jgi:hypothetical protein